MNNGSEGGGGTFSLDNLPFGYRFCPTDEELILCYLRKKVLRQPLPPNRIIQVANLYACHPDQLAERHKPPGGDEWFYFTNLNRNGEGSGSERGVIRGGEYGYWKQTTTGGSSDGGDEDEEEIKTWEEEGRNIIIGYKRALVFYQLDGMETDWMMYEYRLAASDPPPPEKKRVPLQLHTFIFSSPFSSFLPTRKIIGRGRGYKSIHTKPKRIVQELIRVANPPVYPHPPPATHHHNMRQLDEHCTVLCKIFKSSDRGCTSSSLIFSLCSSSTDDASSSSPDSSSNIPQVLEIHTTTTTDQTNDDDFTATGQVECGEEEFTTYAPNLFVDIPHRLQNQQEQQQSINVHEVPPQVPQTKLQEFNPSDQTNDQLTASGEMEHVEAFTNNAYNPFVNIPQRLQNQQQQEQQQPIDVNEVAPQVPHTNLHEVLPPAEAADASTSTSTSFIPKLEHSPDDHNPHQHNGPSL